MKKQNFIIGAILLAVASFLAKIIGAIYRIPLTNILGAEGLGLYQLIFPLYSTILVFSSTGVPNAIAKIIATGNANDNKRVMKLSLIFFTSLSVFFALMLSLFSNIIASAQGNSDIAIIYLGIAPSIVFVGVLSIFRGYFQGKQNIIPTSISIIVEQIFKLIFGLFFAFVLIKKGAMYGALGATIGVSISELFALIVISIEYYFGKRKLNNSDTSISKSEITIKKIISSAMPIAFSSMLMPLTLLIDSFLIVNLLKVVGFSTNSATNLYGLYTGIVNSLINLPVVVSMSVATMAIPIVSKLFHNHNYVEVSQKSSNAFALVLLIAIPCFFVFLLFSNDIIHFLFKNGLKVGDINEFDVASMLLRIGGISVVLIALVQISTTILQAVNMSKVPIIDMAIGCGVKIFLTIGLVSIHSVNIYGAIFSTIVCYLICAVLNIVNLKSFVKINLSMRYDIILPIVASIFMVSIMELIKRVLGQSMITLPTMVCVGGAMYCFIYAIVTYNVKYDFRRVLIAFKGFKKG